MELASWPFLFCQKTRRGQQKRACLTKTATAQKFLQRMQPLGPKGIFGADFATRQICLPIWRLRTWLESAHHIRRWREFPAEFQIRPRQMLISLGQRVRLELPVMVRGGRAENR